MSLTRWASWVLFGDAFHNGVPRTLRPLFQNIKKGLFLYHQDRLKKLSGDPHASLDSEVVHALDYVCDLLVSRRLREEDVRFAIERTLADLAEGARAKTARQLQTLIGLMGFAQVGKDSVAQVLAANGWKQLAFANSLKMIATAIGWDGKKDEKGRKLLQDLGVAARLHLDPNIWVDTTMRTCEREGGKIVISDVRFFNEVQTIREHGGYIVRIERPGYGPVNDHISERLAGDDSVPIDAEIINDGSLDDLPHKVADMLEELDL